jgi:hypothetical protein
MCAHPFGSDRADGRSGFLFTASDPLQVTQQFWIHFELGLGPISQHPSRVLANNYQAALVWALGKL